MKHFAPLRRHANKALAYIPNEPSMRGAFKKNYKLVTELTRGTALWTEEHRSSCKEIYSACAIPGLHLVEWTSSNVGLSYFVTADTVHLSGSRLQLNLQLGPPQVSLLLQQWSKVANFSQLLLSLSNCAFSMTISSAIRQPP